MKYLLLTLVLLSMMGCFRVADSSRTGIIIHAGKNGIFCKTYEASMSVGFTKDGTGTVSKQDFTFTVEDPVVQKQVDDALTSGKPVKISYISELLTWCRSESGGDFAYKIEAL